MKKVGLVAFCLGASIAIPSLAADFDLGDGVTLTAHGTFTAGTLVRTEAPNQNVLGVISSRRVGATPGRLGGNAGSSDLNFEQGHPVSTVVKGVFDVDLKRDNLGVFARAKAWHDFELADGKRAYGNVPSGFQQNAALSDRGFDPAAKFTNAQLADIYGYGKFDTGDGSTLELKVGRQVVNWGTALMIGGGINVINPSDFAAQVRPGALPQEGKIPVGMVYASYQASRELGIDGFAQFEFRPNVLAGCGTFLGTANYAPVGCNYVSVLSGVDDQAAVSSGRYPKREPDILARDLGQFGVSVRYSPADWKTDFRAYALNYHSRAASFRATNPDIGGGYGTLTTRLTEPNGLKYAVIYPEDIQLYGFSAAVNPDPTLKIYGEVAYRPNQPLNINGSDFVAAFVGRSPTSALNLAKGTNAIAPGGFMDGYDRYQVTNGTLGATKTFPKTLGAEAVSVGGEIGWSHVAGLPDHGVLRYGRSDDFGGAAINGVPCVDTSPAQKSCAHDGFVTGHALGYRLRLSATYPKAVLGADLTPSVQFSHDVKGYSWDGTFVEDRTILRPGLRASWNQRYYAEVQYSHIAGGAYNLLIDRDTVALVVGVSF